MKGIIRIGTRSSDLALWQAREVLNRLRLLGYNAEIVTVKSLGDTDLKRPLYDMNITGVFTKALDTALLNNTINIAVHSMKDVPTKLPKGLVQGAVMERGEERDVIINRKTLDLNSSCIIATGSLRRQAQWLNRYPHHMVENIRGNIHLRIQKLKQTPRWDGAIFALVGLKRMKISLEHTAILDWMVPAPGQGAITITCREESPILGVISKINHIPTEQCVKIERDFLSTLEGGCTAPIGALAKIKNNQVEFRGVLLSEDGKKKVEVQETVESHKIKNVGEVLAQQILRSGGMSIIKSMKK